MVSGLVGAMLCCKDVSTKCLWSGAMPQLVLWYLDPAADAIKLRHLMENRIYFLLQMTKIETLSVHDKKRKR